MMNAAYTVSITSKQIKKILNKKTDLQVETGVKSMPLYYVSYWSVSTLMGVLPPHLYHTLLRHSSRYIKKH